MCGWPAGSRAERRGQDPLETLGTHVPAGQCRDTEVLGVFLLYFLSKSITFLRGFRGFFSVLFSASKSNRQRFRVDFCSVETAVEILQ